MASFYQDINARQDGNFGPVRLVYADNPLRIEPGRPLAMIQIEDFATNADAIARASALMGSARFHNPHISDESGNVIMAGHTLRERCHLVKPLLTPSLRQIDR